MLAASDRLSHLGSISRQWTEPGFAHAATAWGMSAGVKGSPLELRAAARLAGRISENGSKADVRRRGAGSLSFMLRLALG